MVLFSRRRRQPGRFSPSRTTELPPSGEGSLPWPRGCPPDPLRDSTGAPPWVPPPGPSRLPTPREACTGCVRLDHRWEVRRVEEPPGPARQRAPTVGRTSAVQFVPCFPGVWPPGTFRPSDQAQPQVSSTRPASHRPAPTQHPPPKGGDGAFLHPVSPGDRSHRRPAGRPRPPSLDVPFRRIEQPPGPLCATGLGPLPPRGIGEPGPWSLPTPCLDPEATLPRRGHGPSRTPNPFFGRKSPAWIPEPRPWGPDREQCLRASLGPSLQRPPSLESLPTPGYTGW